MKLFVTAVVLACAPGVIAQTQVADTPVKPTMPAPQMPRPQGRIRQAVSPNATAKAPVSVPATTPIVTLKGVCKNRQSKGPCQTVITREDLDRYVSLMAPNTSDAFRSRLAVQYASSMTFASLAEQQGLDKNPALAKEIDAELNLVRMRILSGALLQGLQAQSAAVAEMEIHRYYDAHKDRWEQARVLRLAVPISVPTEEGRPLDRAAVKAEMTELRAKAAAGADIAQLQKEAFEHFHILAPPPPLSVAMRRTEVQGDEAKVFDLKPGDMTGVLDLPASVVILKLEGTEARPFETVRAEIETALRGERMQATMTKVAKNVKAEFNLEYLGLSAQPDLIAPSVPVQTAGRARVARPPVPPAPEAQAR